MAMNDDLPLEGSCTCNAIKYSMATRPLVVHCCHCHYCQRETGTAFALNAVIESESVMNLSSTQPEIIHIPSFSGKGQDIARCPICHIAVWSHYPGAGPLLMFVRVGTLDRNHVLKPDIHIYTETKIPWVDLGRSEVPVVEAWYDREEVWSMDSLKRWKVLEPRIQEYKVGLIKAAE